MVRLLSLVERAHAKAREADPKAGFAWHGNLGRALTQRRSTITSTARSHRPS
jgi:hypothetical protein